VVLSPKAYNAKAGLAILCPVTTQAKGYPFEVAMPAGLEVSGVALADQIRSLDWRARKAALICEVPGPAIDEILGKLGTLLDRG
jgi:mRNA interferase MazF